MDLTCLGSSHRCGFNTNTALSKAEREELVFQIWFGLNRTYMDVAEGAGDCETLIKTHTDNIRVHALIIIIMHFIYRRLS